MARKRERTFAAFGAMLFLVTSSATTIIVIYLLVTQNKNGNNAASTNNATSSQQAGEVNSKLDGTQLAGFAPTTNVPKLEEIDTAPGTGATVQPGDTVTVDYTGAVASTGTVFQSTVGTNQPATFSLSQVIAGWSQGIPGMKVGGTRRLLIPAGLAYGNNPPSGSGIPADANLVFDVTVHKIDNGS